MALSPLNYDLSGKLAVVTGASSGIGKEITRGLAAQGATVVMACRNVAKADGVKAELLAGNPKAALELMQLDLASVDSTMAFAKAFGEKHPKLDILVNNAGAWSTAQAKSADGIDLTWQTNVVGPQLLTHLLIPALKASGKARIVNVSSTVASGLDLDDIEFKKRKFSGVTNYSQTKQAGRMLSWGWAAKLQGSGITANAMSPGLIKTDLNRDARGFVGFMFSLLVPMMAKSPAQGADTAIWLASSSELDGVSGKFYENRKEVACKYRDEGEIKKLEEICVAMVSGRSGKGPA